MDATTTTTGVCEIFLVKHRHGEEYAATNRLTPGVTPRRQGACKFFTRDMAEACRTRMRLPSQWTVVKTIINRGQVAEHNLDEDEE